MVDDLINDNHWNMNDSTIEEDQSSVVNVASPGTLCPLARPRSPQHEDHVRFAHHCTSEKYLYHVKSI